MQTSGTYSHKNGLNYINEKHPKELNELRKVVKQLNPASVLTKLSSEKSKPDLLFSPIDMNDFLKQRLCILGWTEYSKNSAKGYIEPRIYLEDGAEYREMDGIKNKVGLEIQFGKYAFMGYDIFSKMVIFSKNNLIDCGIELVVMPSMIKNMSTGVSSYNQIVMDMEARGEADIDIPTLVIGMEPTDAEWTEVEEKRKRYEEDPQALINNGEVKKDRKGAKPGPK